MHILQNFQHNPVVNTIFISKVRLLCTNNLYKTSQGKSGQENMAVVERLPLVDVRLHFYVLNLLQVIAIIN